MELVSDGRSLSILTSEYIKCCHCFVRQGASRLCLSQYSIGVGNKRTYSGHQRQPLNKGTSQAVKDVNIMLVVSRRGTEEDEKCSRGVALSLFRTSKLEERVANSPNL